LGHASQERKKSAVEATYAVVCSYLGLTSRDLAEIGNFSERFARDLLAGRRPFPKDVQTQLLELWRRVALIHEALYQEVVAGNPTIYIYRTTQQLRRSPVGQVWAEAFRQEWPKPYLGPYRVAAFEVRERCIREGRRVFLVFADVPVVTGERDA
jgi:hypothetical protein